MKIFLLISILLVAVLFFGRSFFYSAKRNLFKDQAVWSGKDIKIKYSARIDVSESKENENYLKKIADESKIFLDNQSNDEEDQTK